MRKALKKEVNWAKEDRPREKLTDYGAASLTDVELLTIMLGTGTASDHVSAIAQKMVDKAESDLGRLAGLPIRELMGMDGVGHAKAVLLKAAIEFARRAQFATVPRNFKITASQQAFHVFVPNLGDLPHEEFWIALLNRHSKIIGKKRISQGGINSTVVDPRLIFSSALEVKASSIIVAHNHPSGNLTPSQADIELTKKLVGAGKLLDIQLVDHLIISGNNYCSFADSGLL